MAYTLRDVEVDVLMRLQYEFPLSPTPFVDVAEGAGLSFEGLSSILRDLVMRKILKRVGFYYNYRAQGHVAALVAFSCRGRYEALAEALREDPLVTHSFLRDHPVYDVWAVIKRGSKEELLDYVRGLAFKGDVGGWIALFSKRTFKLSVKFDLREGISRAGPYSAIVENPPKPEDLGINPLIPKYVRVLHITERPYAEIASRVGLSEDEIVSLVREMLKKGILADPGAALEGHNIGFSENAMVVLEPESDEYELCECVSKLPYTTHVVLREPYPPGSWSHTCYFMVHATSRDKIVKVLDEASRLCRPKSMVPIYSIADLKPEVVR